jgi:hypothetical protein
LGLGCWIAIVGYAVYGFMRFMRFIGVYVSAGLAAEGYWGLWLLVYWLSKVRKLVQAIGIVG